MVGGKSVMIMDQGTLGKPMPVGSKLEPVFRRIYREDALKRKQDMRCAYCYQPLTVETATADHVHPKIKGGMTSRKNIKAVCRPCNRTKGSMPLGRFRKWIAQPPEGCSLYLLLAHSRWRIWRRQRRAEKRILNYVGVT